MEDYKPNSHLSKQEEKKELPAEKKVEKVIEGTAKVRKKGFFQRLSDAVIQEDADNVKSYILDDVLIPAFIKLIDDTVSEGIHMLLYGKSGRGSRRRDEKSYTSYGRFYDDRDRKERRDSRARFRDYDDIVFDTRGDAEEVLMALDDVIDRYGTVSIAELYDLAGMTAPPYTSNKYGWTDLRSAEVLRVRDGYIIKLPRIREL